MKQKFTPYIYILFLLYLFNPIYGQKIKLKISSIDSLSTAFLQNISYQKKHASEISLHKSLDSVKRHLEKIGFLNYKIDSISKRPFLIPPEEGDSIVEKEYVYTAYFNLRNQIKRVKVYYSEIDIPKKLIFNMDHLSVKDNYFELNPENLPKTLNLITSLFEKQGNSFTKIALKNIAVKKDTLEAELQINKSNLRKIDNVIINGYPDFPKAFVKHHLKLKNNTLFTKDKLDEASNSINSLSFVSETKPPEILFTKDSTIVYLYLKKKSSNKFDGLIGFTSKENGKGLLFNGHIDLSLNNIFNTGENFSLIWKNNGKERQVFDISISLPYIFNSKFSPNSTLNIYKQDSSFVNTLIKFSLPYQIDNRKSIGLTLQSESSTNLLSNNNNTIIDYKNLFYGLNYNYQLPNTHPLFPTKFNFYSEALIGRRKSNDINTRQTKLFAKTHFIWSLTVKNHIFIQNQSAYLKSEALFDNELFRIGGTNSIRGFDEESLLASTYSILNIEYRFTPNNTSYLYSITDFGYTKNNKQDTKLYSFGLGYAFSSKLGLVNLSYALGGSSNFALNFDNSRFHLKIVSYF